MYVVGSKIFPSEQQAVEYYGNILVWILKRADNLTPIDTGRLVNSYKLERYGQEINEIRIVNDCEYAIYVHEIESYHINGQSKFLEYAGWLAMQVFDGLVVSIELDEDYIALYIDDLSHGVDITGKYDNDDIEFEFTSASVESGVTQSVSIQEIANSENKLLDRLNNINRSTSSITEDTDNTVDYVKADDWSTRPLDNASYGVFLDMYLEAMGG